MVLKHENMRALGALIDALFLKNRAVTADVTQILTRLLPQTVCDPNFVLIPAELSQQKQQLKLLLTRGKTKFLPNNADLDIAAIQYFGRFGDAPDESWLKRIAAGTLRSGRHPEVRLAAAAAIDEIKKREVAARAPEVLLRPAEPASSNQEVLLRPARDSGAAESDLLLRVAVDGPD